METLSAEEWTGLHPQTSQEHPLQTGESTQADPDPQGPGQTSTKVSSSSMRLASLTELVSCLGSEVDSLSQDSDSSRTSVIDSEGETSGADLGGCVC